jgi:GTP-binding protein
MQAMLQRHSQVAAAAATRNFLRSSTRGKQHGSYKFVDRIKVAVRGGRGGNGCRSYEILSPAKKRPSGGNGGKGGNVYIVADKEVTNLNFETIAFNAGDGGNGSSKQMTGRNGKDIIIKVPLGTVVRNDYSREEEMSDHDTMLEMFGIDDPQQKPPPDPVFTMKEDGLRKTTYNGFEWEEIRVGEDESDENYVGNADDDQEEIDDDSENDIQFDLQTHGEKLLVARGGRAGMGNAAMARIAKLVKRSSPASKSPGEVGQARDLMLELKTIADVGLVGFPNVRSHVLCSNPHVEHGQDSRYCALR